MIPRRPILAAGNRPSAIILRRVRGSQETNRAACVTESQEALLLSTPAAGINMLPPVSAAKSPGGAALASLVYA